MNEGCKSRGSKAVHDKRIRGGGSKKHTILSDSQRREGRKKAKRKICRLVIKNKLLKDGKKGSKKKRPGGGEKAGRLYCEKDMWGGRDETYDLTKRSQRHRNGTGVILQNRK